MTTIPPAIARLLVGRGADRLLSPPTTSPAEALLGPRLDELGGEVVRLRARDGGRLAGRWLPPDDPTAAWAPDPHEAIVLLHGWSGSIAPDLLEYGAFLRRTAGVLGIDFRGHGDSDPGPTTFGWREVEDVAGALAWLGDRGVTRVALFGTSMGGMTALASVVVLGDGSLPSADTDPDAPAHDIAAPRPRLVGVVADSVAPEATLAVANRMRLPFRRFLAARMFEVAGERVGGDLRATEPIRIIGLVEDVPVLLVHGTVDSTVPLKDGRRLARAAGPNVEHWEVDGGTHSGSHEAAPGDYEARVESFLQRAFSEARGAVHIIGESVLGAPVTDEAPAGGELEGD
jgi:pimeloyl-ACP methyl ester carboxylesterase